VRPDGRRRINRPSDVIPVTRLRTERVRPCWEYAAELRLARARFDFEATDFSVLFELDWLAVAGGGSVFAWTDEFASVLETELSGVGATEFSAEFVGAAGCD
jgi:hypothetical protein